MTSLTSDRTATARSDERATGADRAFLLLRVVFSAAPIVFGLDKFTDLLTNWDDYLAPWINELMPGSAHALMMVVGVVEICAGLLVALVPRYGAPLVAAWLFAIIVSLLTMGGFDDIAMRDAGLMCAAVALAFLAWDRRGADAS